MRIDRPAADVDDRLTCGHQGLQGAFNLPFMATGGWVIRAHAHCVRPDVRQLLRRIENILRQIDHYRTGATAGRQPEGFLQHAGNIFTRKLCFTTGREIPTMSHSWKAS